MIIRENQQTLQLLNSNKAQIKYILLLLTGIWLFFFFSVSIFELFFGKTLYFGNTISELLTQLTFFIVGNIVFVIFTILAIYISLKHLLRTNTIIFDKINLEALFLTQQKLFKKSIIKKIPFSEILEIKVEQEKDSDYIIVSLSQKDQKIEIESDYGIEGMERLNQLAESIQKLVNVPFEKGLFEDIYKADEEESKEKEKKDKK